MDNEHVKKNLKHVFSTTGANKVYLTPDGHLFLSKIDADNNIRDLRSNKEIFVFHRETFIQEVNALNFV